MKIGILTFHRAMNYGAVLQAYALCEALRRVGAQPEIIDYRCPRIERQNNKKRFPRLPTVGRVVTHLRHGVHINRRIDRFEAFRTKNLPLSGQAYTPATLASARCDRYITGSDQVWNQAITDGDRAFFLDFVADPDQKCAYAASFGAYDLPDYQRDQIRALIEDFGFITVREDSGAQIVRALTGREVPVVLDPSMLLTRAEWLEAAGRPENRGGYVLIHTYGGIVPPDLIEYGRGVAAARGVGALAVAPTPRMARNIQKILGPDPFEFVRLIAGADCVVTNSFHAAAISIALERDFFLQYSVEMPERNTRLDKLLALTGLESRRIGEKSAGPSEPVDYARAREALERARRDSFEMLHAIVRGERQPPASPDPVVNTAYADKSHCSGCGACARRCPQGAIGMLPDEEGFLYPRIDREACVNCGLCREVCPFSHPSAGHAPQRVLAAKHAREEVRAGSASGGAFTALSDAVLLSGGTVFGAVFDPSLNVLHASARTKEARDAMRVSKYVQSDLGDSFEQARARLSAGETVFFTGTPCQIAGLYAALGGDHPNLITADLICKGAPSPLIWKEHLAALERSEKSPVVAYTHRSKRRGWHGHIERVTYQNGREDDQSRLSQSYKKLFHANLILRPSCYACAFARSQRQSDLTMADYWGVEDVLPDFDDNRGVSLLLVNTPKGERLLERARDALLLRETSLKDAEQPHIVAPVAASPNRDAFWALYARHGYDRALIRFAGIGARNAIRRALRRALPEPGRRFVARLMRSRGVRREGQA